MDISSESKNFECSYCGTQWLDTRARMTNRKKNSVIWNEYKSTCPNCSHETTNIEYKSRGDQKCS